MKKLLLLLSLFVGTAFAAAPVIWQNGEYAKWLVSLGFIFDDGKEIRTIAVDPSAGAGVAAEIGSIALQDDSGVGRAWFKLGSGDTAWTDVLTSGSGWSLFGNAGTTAGTNFIGTTDAIDFVIKTDDTERFRITSGGSYDTTLGLGIVHSDSSGVLSSSAIVNADVDAAAAIAYSKLNLTDSIVNADVNTAAAIAGTKISPDFGAQNITTTGDLSVSDATVTGLTDGLVSSASGVLSGGASVDLTTQVTGVLPLANGGTEKALTAAAGGVVYSDADSFEILAAGTQDYVLQSNGTGAPSWVDPSTFSPTTTLQDAYDNGADGVIDLDGTRNGIRIQDAAGSIGVDLFEVTDSANSTEYFKVNTNGAFATQFTAANLTSGRVALSGASGLITDSANFTYSGGALNNTDGTSAVYRLTKSGTGAGSFEIGYFGTGAGAILNGASLTNPIYVAQGGNIQTHFQTDGDVRFYDSILLQETSATTDYVGLVAPTDISSSYSLTLPSAAPTAVGEILIHGGSNSLAFTKFREINTFTGTSFTGSVHPNQTWRYEGVSDQTMTEITTTDLLDGYRITILNTSAFVLTIPFDATGIAYQNGTLLLGPYQSITYEFVSGDGLVEVK